MWCKVAGFGYMFIISYHAGAMGNTVRALIESCTLQFNKPLPHFIKDQNLHRYPTSDFVKCTHEFPDDLRKNISHDAKIIGVTFLSQFSKLLVDVMSFGKWHKQFPIENNLIRYPDYNNLTLGQQIEIFSISLNNPEDELLEIKRANDADIVFDIDWFFNNKQKIIDFLEQLGLTVVTEKLDKFIEDVHYTNKTYLDKVKKCYDITNLCINDIKQNIEINFYETCLIHFLLVNYYKISYNEMKLLSSIPDNTDDFIKIFKD